MNTKGKSPKTPNIIKKMLLADEEVFAVIRQSKLKAIFTPDSIIITNFRIIRCSPSKLGLHHEIEDYRYEDIANIKINKGIIFANIIIKRRFMSKDLILDNLRSNQVDYLCRIIEENLRRVSSSQYSQAPNYHQAPLSTSEDPLQTLRMRFAKGELTQKQFEEMKKQLE
jgi:hypothetical protein